MLLAQASTHDPSAGAIAGLAAMSGFFILVGLAIMLFTLFVYFMIVKKTGYNPWLSLLMLVPVANFVVLLILAFSEWPVERELKMLRGGHGGGYVPPGGYMPPPGTTVMPT